MAGSRHDFVPDGHVLARVDRVLDLSWLRAQVPARFWPRYLVCGKPAADLIQPSTSSIGLRMRWLTA